jgi:hypothetical protein
MGQITHRSFDTLPARYRIVLLTPEERAERDAATPPGGDGTPTVAWLDGTGEPYPPHVSAAALGHLIALGRAHDTE